MRQVDRRQRRFWRSVEERSVLVIGGAALVVLLLAVVRISVEAPRSSWLSRLYSAAGLFAGNYLPAQGQGATPSRSMGALGLLALSLTFVAALAAVLATTARARERFRARTAGTALIVLGNGTAAAAMIRRSAHTAVSEVLLVSDNERSTAALAARDRAAMLITDLDALDDQVVSSLRARGGRIVVAADDDAVTLDLSHRLSGAAGPACELVAVLGHAGLVDELRPAEIGGDSVDTFGVTSPAENTAGKVCQELDQLWSKDDELIAAGHGAVVVDGDGSELASTVRLWVSRLSWARSFIRGEDGQPVARLDPLSTEELQIGPAPVTFHVVVGPDGAEVAARALRLMRRDGLDGGRMVVVTSESLLPTARRGRMVLVDPRTTAWDPDLVFEDTATRWGRLFHSVYGVAYAKVTPWASEAAGRRGQSSVAAGRFLPANLAKHGFHLVKVDGRPAPPDFTEDEITSLAATEHEAWLGRTWSDGGVDRPVADEHNVYRKAWCELTSEQRDRNRNLVLGAAAALPALLGYEVRRRSAR
jgi:hypothetical protein